MRFTDRETFRAWGLVAAVAALGGCTTRSSAPPSVPAVPASQAARPPAAAPAAAVAYRARHWDEYRVLAARKIVDANPAATYLGVPPEPLLAIPVLEVELQGDGSIVNITVQRQPSQARDTVQLAVEAVRRAAPFGPVAHLPRPWKFSEVFLFDDARRFKPRSLD